MYIADLQPNDAAAIEQAAHALVVGFRDQAPDAWPDLAAARAEVQEALESGKVCRVAHDTDGSVLGWIGGHLFYARVWELHPPPWLLLPTMPPSAQRPAVPRSSERPAARRDHCEIGRPLLRNPSARPLFGQPSGESSHGSWRP